MTLADLVFNASAVQNSRCSMHPHINSNEFADPEWERIRNDWRDEIFLPVLRGQVQRAMDTMPKVYHSYGERGIDHRDIRTMDNFYSLPVLPKDASFGIRGLRQLASEDPYALLPNDVEGSATAYFSGGTRAGTLGPSPTFLTPWDIEVESHAFARLYERSGLKRGSVVINTYNASHKGGRAVIAALEKLGCIHIQAKSSDKAEDIAGYIQQFGARGVVLIGVQPPVTEGDPQGKGSGRTIHAIRDVDPIAFDEYVKHVQIGGSPIIPELEAWSRSGIGKPVISIYGATEVLPVFFGTGYGLEDRLCKYNTLHASYGPHLVEVLKLEGKRMVPVQKGETGLLALTTVFREGTILLRYLIGDEARFIGDWNSCPCGATTPLYDNIRRTDVPEEILNTGCVSL